MKLSRFSIKVKLVLKKVLIDLKSTHLRDIRNNFLASLKKLPGIIHLKNLVFFSGLLGILILALFIQRFTRLEKYYVKEKPDYGSSYNQGVVGLIDKMNPLFVQDDAESAANRLIFSGLTREVDGSRVIPDLAKSWSTSSDGKIYNFILNRDITWHDGHKFTAEDIVYTIGLIQNPDTKTPLNSTWNGVVVSKINDFEVKFTLPSQYPDFIKVAKQPILPSHLLKGIDPKNIKIAEFNQKPVGTGPFMFVRFDQMGSQPEVVLRRNDNFAISKPYLSEVNLITYDDNKSLFEGLLRQQVDSVFEISPENYINLKKLPINSIKSGYLPEAQVVYLNLKNSFLSDKNAREAIASAIDRKELLGGVISGMGQTLSTPIAPGQLGYDGKVKAPSFDIINSEKILDSLGWIKNKDGKRFKDGKLLELRIIYPNNFENKTGASIIKQQLSKIGVKINEVAVDPGQIGLQYIKPRNFDLLLVAQNVGLNQDWFSFWGSSQINSPGLNLSGFSDKRMDKFVEQLRISSNRAYRIDRYKQAQTVLLEQNPIIYLYRKKHVFAISEKIKGYEQVKYSNSLDILNNVYDWYINIKKTY